MKTLLRGPYHRLFRVWLQVRWWWADRFQASPAGLRSLAPPARLRYKVSENNSLEDFLRVGERSAELVRTAFAGLGVTLGVTLEVKTTPPLTVLDFGCGCGRTLGWLTRQYPDLNWFGTDTDPEATAWCRQNLGAAILTNGPLPPLPAGDGQFDVIYGISVFTHLDEEHQLAWLAELARVLKPGGWVVLSIYGEHIWRARKEAAGVVKDGFVFSVSSKHRGLLPDWYHTAFQTRERITRNTAKYFAEVRYIPQGFGDHDLVAARKG